MDTSFAVKCEVPDGMSVDEVIFCLLVTKT